MFGIDFSEIVVIFGLALVVLGPEKLPKVAATIGRWVGRARAMARQFQEQLNTEAENLKANVSDVRTDLQSGASELQSSIHDAEQQVSEIGQQLKEQPKPAAADSDEHERGS